jgi:hypothetical protein
MAVFYMTLDIGITNAYLLYKMACKDANEKPLMKHGEFREALAVILASGSIAWRSWFFKLLNISNKTTTLKYTVSCKQFTNGQTFAQMVAYCAKDSLTKTNAHFRMTLEANCPVERGGLATLRAKSRVAGHYIYAAQFRTSSKHKVTFLSSAFSCATSPQRYTTRAGHVFDQPVVSEIWYKYYGRVDQFNHVKVGAGKRGWEHMLKTQDKPDLAIVMGLMSMIDANIFLALKYFKPAQWAKTTHQQLREMLAHYLLSKSGHVANQGNAADGYVDDHVMLFREVDKKTTKGKACAVHEYTFPQHNKNNYRSLLYCGRCGEDQGYICVPRKENGATCWNHHVIHGFGPAD